MYVHRNEAHFTYIYVYHMNVSEADNIYKTLLQMSFHLYFLLFLFRSGAPPMTLLIAGALTDHRLPATLQKETSMRALDRLQVRACVLYQFPPPTNGHSVDSLSDLIII